MNSSTFQFTHRKHAIVKIKLINASRNLILINQKSVSMYFLKNFSILLKLKQILKLFSFSIPVFILIKTQGGGLESQGKAIIQGLARLLIATKPAYESCLVNLGFLVNDIRRKERKKYGLRKARKAPQYSKR